MYRYFQKLGITVLLIGLLVGCAGSPPRNAGMSVEKPRFSVPTKPYTTHHGNTYQRLHAQYERWKGTPYSLGGLNKRGIDCSGFVHVAYRDGLGIEVPRSTEALADEGTPVTKQNLNIGDLVFFKTGITKRHVGIYIGNQQFIHASTSQGVMKSNLTSPYWSQHYWKSTRLIAN